MIFGFLDFWVLGFLDFGFLDFWTFGLLFHFAVGPLGQFTSPVLDPSPITVLNSSAQHLVGFSSRMFSKPYWLLEQAT